MYLRWKGIINRETKCKALRRYIAISSDVEQHDNLCFAWQQTQSDVGVQHCFGVMLPDVTFEFRVKSAWLVQGIDGYHTPLAFRSTHHVQVQAKAAFPGDVDPLAAVSVRLFLPCSLPAHIYLILFSSYQRLSPGSMKPTSFYSKLINVFWASRIIDFIM